VGVNLTLVGQMITFILFVLFTMRYVWPPVQKAMQDRQRRIAEGLAAAERGQLAEREAQEHAAAALREARAQARDIVAQAERRAGEVLEEARRHAGEEGERLLAGARAQIEQEIRQAREALRDEVGGLVVQGAERILRREVDARAHEDLLRDLAAQL
jgi:F-type H+-transporting ATPase subunit b